MKITYRLVAFAVFAITGICLGLLIEGESPAGAAINDAAKKRPSPRSIASVVIDVNSPSYTNDLIRMVNSAEQTIRLYTDILLLRPVLEALQEASKRGVQIEIVLDRTDENLKLLERWVPHNLSAADIWTVEYGNSPTFIVVDNSRAIITSLSLSETDKITRNVIAVATTEIVAVEDLINQFLHMKEDSKL